MHQTMPDIGIAFDCEVGQTEQGMGSNGHQPHPAQTAQNIDHSRMR